MMHYLITGLRYALAVVAVIVGGLLVMDAKADAAAPGCTVTRAEYAKVHRGMTMDRVARIVGCAGKTSSAMTIGGTRYVDKTYRVYTGRWGMASVSFEGSRGNPVRVTSKWVVW
jgi:hypothetical protein